MDDNGVERSDVEFHVDEDTECVGFFVLGETLCEREEAEDDEGAEVWWLTVVDEQD